MSKIWIVLFLLLLNNIYFDEVDATRSTPSNSTKMVTEPVSKELTMKVIDNATVAASNGTAATETVLMSSILSTGSDGTSFKNASTASFLTLPESATTPNNTTFEFSTNMITTTMFNILDNFTSTEKSVGTTKPLKTESSTVSNFETSKIQTRSVIPVVTTTKSPLMTKMTTFAPSTSKNAVTVKTTKKIVTTPSYMKNEETTASFENSEIQTTTDNYCIPKRNASSVTLSSVGFCESVACIGTTTTLLTTTASKTTTTTNIVTTPKPITTTIATTKTSTTTITTPKTTTTTIATTKKSTTLIATPKTTTTTITTPKTTTTTIATTRKSTTPITTKRVAKTTTELRKLMFTTVKPTIVTTLAVPTKTQQKKITTPIYAIKKTTTTMDTTPGATMLPVTILPSSSCQRYMCSVMASTQTPIHTTESTSVTEGVNLTLSTALDQNQTTHLPTSTKESFVTTSTSEKHESLKYSTDATSTTKTLSAINTDVTRFFEATSGNGICSCNIKNVENIFSVDESLVRIVSPTCFSTMSTTLTVSSTALSTTKATTEHSFITTDVTASENVINSTKKEPASTVCQCDAKMIETIFTSSITFVRISSTTCLYTTMASFLTSTSDSATNSQFKTTESLAGSTSSLEFSLKLDDKTTSPYFDATSTKRQMSSKLTTVPEKDSSAFTKMVTSVTKQTASNCKCNNRAIIETIFTNSISFQSIYSLCHQTTVATKLSFSDASTTSSTDDYRQTDNGDQNTFKNNDSSDVTLLSNAYTKNFESTQSDGVTTISFLPMSKTVNKATETTAESGSFSSVTQEFETVFTSTANWKTITSPSNVFKETESTDGSDSKGSTAVTSNQMTVTSEPADTTDQTKNVFGSSTNAEYIDSVTPISSVTNGENYSTDSEKTSSRTKPPSLKCKNFGVMTENGTCKCTEGYFGEECDTVLPSSSPLAKTNSFTTTENIKTTTPTNSAIDEKDSTDSKETTLKTETPSLQCKNSGTYNENGTCTCTDGYFGEECEAALPSSTLATASVVVGVAIAASQSSSSKLKYLWPRYSTLVRTPITPHEFFRLMGTYFLTVALGINSMLGLPSTSDIEHLPKCAMAYLFGTGAFFLSLTAMIFEAGIDALTLSGMRFNAWARPAERRTRCFSFVPTFILYVLIGIAPTAGLWLKHWTDVVTSRSCIGALGYGDFSRDMKTASWLQLAVTLFYLTVAAVLGLLAVACNKFDVCRCRRRTEAWSINPFIYGHEIWPLEANAYFWLVAIQPVLFSVCWLSYMLVNEQRTTAVQWINLILTSIYSATSSLQSALTTSGQLSNTVCSGMTMIPEGMLSFMPSIDHVSLKDKRSILKAQMHAKDWEKFEQKELNNGPVPLYPVRNDSIPFGLTQYMCSLWTVNYMRLRERGSTVDDSLKTMACQFLEQLPDLRTINTLQFAYLFAHWISEVRDKDSDAVSPAILKKSRRILDRQMDLNVPPPMIVINENGTETVYRRKISHLTPMDGQKKVVRARKESKHCDIALDDTQPAFIGPKCQENAVHALVPHELVVAYHIDYPASSKLHIN